MKVEIEISEVHVKALLDHGSLSRTLAAAIDLLETSEGDDDHIHQIQEELADIRTPLDMLHQAFKSAVRANK